MSFETFECVVLTHDVPEHGLRAGDLGAEVELWEPDAFEVEFVAGDGTTRALLTLHSGDVRKAGSDDILAVRATA